MFGPKRNKSFARAKPPVESLDLAGKKVAVVGGTDGLGRAIALAAAARGAEVVVVGRTNRVEGVAGVSFAKADLSLMREAAALGASEALPTDLDVLVFTTGILAAPKREETAEGLERDMAVSYLSRLAVLDAYAPRLASTAGAGQAPLRLFVMGFPGAGNGGNWQDPNAEQSYKPFPQHMTTVAGNEALVAAANSEWGAAAEGPRARPIEAFGLNPGLIRTGIRQNYMGTGRLAGVVEWIIGKLCVSPEGYARTIVPLLFAPELAGHPRLLFNQGGDAIQPSPQLKDPQTVGEILRKSRQLIARALAAQLPAPENK